MAKNLLSYLKGLFAKGDFVKNVLTVSTGIVIGQSLAMVAASAITRLYGPGDLGILGVYGSLLTSFAGISSLRYVYPIPLPKSDIAVALSLLTLAMMGLAGEIFVWHRRNLVCHYHE